MVTSAVLGDTYVINSKTINSLRVTFNKSSIEKTQVPFFGASDLGIQGITEIIPKYLLVTVSNALYSAAGATYPGYLYTTTYQIADDVSLIRGNHHIQFGGNYVRPIHKIWIYLNTAGAFTFNGQVTGLPMADFLIGSPSSFAQNTISNDRERQRNFGLYLQDSWRITPRLTANYGLRWDPYFGTVIPNGWVSHFDMNAFLNNVRSSALSSAISEPVESQCRKADWSQLAGKGKLSGKQHDSLLESAGSESVAVHSRKLQRWTIRTHSGGPMFHHSEFAATPPVDVA